jgi:hypothetical protein
MRVCAECDVRERQRIGMTMLAARRAAIKMLNTDRKRQSMYTNTKKRQRKRRRRLMLLDDLA